jgi:hypothetical protein
VYVADCIFKWFLFKVDREFEYSVGFLLIGVVLKKIINFELIW